MSFTDLMQANTYKMYKLPLKKVSLFICFSFTIGYLSGQSKQAYVNAGSRAMADGDYYSAGTFFSKALAFDATDHDLMLKMASASRLYNDYLGAANWYEKYLNAGEKIRDSSAIFYLAEMKKYLGLYTQARFFYKQYAYSHVNDSSFMSIKSVHEMSSCDKALLIVNDTLSVDVINAGNRINTVYSDFAAQQSGDSLLLFSSQRFRDIQKDKKKKDTYISKILKTSPLTNDSPLPADRIFNPPGFLNCNSMVSADFRLMIFSRCTAVNTSTYHAQLFLSEWKNGKWQNPVKLSKEINSKEFNSTQACIASNGINGYIIYYTSDRPGGFGGMDLWQCAYANGVLGTSQNLGPVINSPGNEVTPFFDNLNSKLYFSSDWHTGIGGFDVFKSSLVNGQFSAPENVGYPLNSSCNDLYFTIQNNGKEGLLTSNRPGSMYLYSQTCCYDIYRYRWNDLDTVEKKDDSEIMDSILLAEENHRWADSTQISLLLPLKLYFDNDQPGKRSMDTTTRKSYDETYHEYLAVKADYLKAFAGKLNDDKLTENDINRFFNETIEASYQQLASFTELLSRQLLSGRQITLTVQGCASPLAKSDYNEKLSKRRISSLVNFLKKYRNGILLPFLVGKTLVIIEDPAGESLAGKKVSDDYHNKRNSVYHPDACLERRIEIVAIRYNN